MNVKLLVKISFGLLVLILTINNIDASPLASFILHPFIKYVSTGQFNKTIENVKSQPGESVFINNTIENNNTKHIREKRMVPLIATAGKISAIGATALLSTKSNKDNFHDVYNVVKNKIMNFIGMNSTTDVSTTPSNTPIKLISNHKVPAIITLRRKMKKNKIIEMNDVKNNSVSRINNNNKRKRRFAVAKMDGYVEFKPKNITVDEFGVSRNRSRRVAPFLMAAGKVVGLAGSLVLAGVATSYIDSEIKQKYARDAEERLIRRTIDCSNNNFGCLEFICWSNCGPRLASADWCATTDGRVGPNKTVRVATCKTDADCNKCWPCATACRTEHSQSYPHALKP